MPLVQALSLRQTSREFAARPLPMQTLSNLLHGHLEKVLAGLILDRAKRNRLNTATGIPGDLFAHYLASAFVLVLDWWVDHGARLAPEEVN
jgi:hypothetical protein